MSKSVEAKLDKILHKLSWLIPDVFALPANSPDMSAGIHFLPVHEICYITTDHKNEHYRLLYKMQDGLEFFSNHQLQDVEKKLSSNPRFMRSQKSYMINLYQIRRMEYSSARDLYFAKDTNPVSNAVSLSYLDEFKRRFEDANK
ncbi:LytTR family transcriptional regulator [bacterium]|nr:LytTR family transcriptional regulator [bacterium]